MFKGHFTVLVIGLLGISCAAILQPRPGYKEIPECSGPTGRRIRAPNQINSALQDCYICESAQRCFDRGGNYCCNDNMCSECGDSPVNFGHGHDGGAR